MNDLKSKLAEFLSQANDKFSSSCWLETEDGTIYVRKSVRFIGEMRRTMLDIANINIKNQRQGIFKEFLKFAEKNNKWDGVYVENVLIKGFALYLERIGYSKNGYGVDNPEVFIQSYYKLRNGIL